MKNNVLPKLQTKLQTQLQLNFLMTANKGT